MARIVPRTTAAERPFPFPASAGRQRCPAIRHGLPAGPEETADDGTGALVGDPGGAGSDGGEPGRLGLPRLRATPRVARLVPARHAGTAPETSRADCLCNRPDAPSHPPLVLPAPR